VLARSGQVDEAIRQLEAAKRLNPHAPEPSYGLSHIFRTRGDHQRAEEELHAFQQLKRWTEREKDAAVLRGKANDLLAKSDARGAATIYREALKLDPNNAKAYYNLSLALEQLGERREEKQILEVAAKLDPNLAEAHNRLGILSMAEEKMSEAEREFKVAVATNPAYAEAKNNLAVLFGRQGKYSEATGLLLEAMKDDPQYVEAYVNLGLLLASQGKYAEAEQQLYNALRISPDNRSALAALRLVEKELARHKK